MESTSHNTRRLRTSSSYCRTDMSPTPASQFLTPTSTSPVCFASQYPRKRKGHAYEAGSSKKVQFGRKTPVEADPSSSSASGLVDIDLVERLTLLYNDAEVQRNMLDQKCKRLKREARDYEKDRHEWQVEREKWGKERQETEVVPRVETMAEKSTQTLEERTRPEDDNPQDCERNTVTDLTPGEKSDLQKARNAIEARLGNDLQDGTNLVQELINPDINLVCSTTISYIRRSKSERASFETQIATLNEELKQARQTNNSIISPAALEKIENLQRQKSSLEQERESLLSQTDQEKQLKKQLSADLREMQRVIDHQKAELLEKTAALCIDETEINALTSKVKELEECLEREKSQACLQSQAATLLSKKFDAEKESLELSKKQLETERRERLMEMSDLTQALQREKEMQEKLREELKELQQTRLDHEVKMAGLTLKNQSLSQAIFEITNAKSSKEAALSEEIVVLRNREAEFSLRNEKLLHEIETAQIGNRKNEAALRKDIDDLRMQISYLVSSLEEAERKNKERSQNHKRQMDENSEKQAAQMRKMDSLHKDEIELIRFLESKCQSLTKRLGEKSEKERALTSETETLLRKVEEFKSSLEEAERKCQKFSASYATLYQEKSSLQVMTKSLEQKVLTLEASMEQLTDQQARRLYHSDALVNTLRQRAQELQNAAARSATDKRAVEQERDLVLHKNAELEEKYRKDFTKLKAEKTKANKTIWSLTAELRRPTTALADERNRQLEKELNELKSQITSIHRTITDLYDQAAQILPQPRDIVSGSADRSPTAALRNISLYILQLQDENQKTEKNYATEVPKLQSQLTGLEGALKMQTEEVTALHKKYQEAKDNNIKQRAEISHIGSTLQSLLKKRASFCKDCKVQFDKDYKDSRGNNWFV